MLPQRPERTFAKLAHDLDVRVAQVTSVVALFDAGNSVPFVARYRQEQTGRLSDAQLRQLHCRLEALDELERTRESVMAELRHGKHLTSALTTEINSAESLEVLEEIRQPFKTRQVSKSTLAREAGMEPLAMCLLEEAFTPVVAATLSRGLPLARSLEHARCIIGEDVVRMPEIKSSAEAEMKRSGAVQTSKTPLAQRVMEENAAHPDARTSKVASGLDLSHSANDPRTYEQYFSAKLGVKRMKTHQILAVNRAEKLGFLNVGLEWTADSVRSVCLDYILRQCRNLSPFSVEQITMAVEHGVSHCLMPSTERQTRRALTERAVVDATATFSRNLWSLLMAPPLPGVIVMGVDPGFRHGCKLCVCDPQGAILCTETIYPHRTTDERRSHAAAVLVDAVLHFSVEAIALGDGVGSKETETFIHAQLTAIGVKIGWAIVSEDGASVYSASELASEELPDLDVSLRGAVSIARRLQDPLAELVKIDPSHLGVGLFQHDIDRSLLQENLRGVVESAVNTVGVDVNTASPSLLSYVAGLSPTLARNIVHYRSRHHAFVDRSELLQVDGIDPKTFLQCAGFLRIRSGDNALDNTGVHPESYFVVLRLLELFMPDRMVEDNVSKEDLSELRGVLMTLRRRDDLKLEPLAQEIGIGLPTLEDIVENVLAPGRDIRGHCTTLNLSRSDQSTIESLKVGDKLPGVVKNVVEFGAFVDINVGVTGLVHVGQMRSASSPQEWIDAHSVCKVGDRVHVEVLDVNLDKGRVSLKILDHEL